MHYYYHHHHFSDGPNSIASAHMIHLITTSNSTSKWPDPVLVYTVYRIPAHTLHRHTYRYFKNYKLNFKKFFKNQITMEKTYYSALSVILPTQTKINLIDIFIHLLLIKCYRIGLHFPLLMSRITMSVSKKKCMFILVCTCGEYIFLKLVGTNSDLSSSKMVI